MRLHILIHKLVQNGIRHTNGLSGLLREVFDLSPSLAFPQKDLIDMIRN